MAAANPISQPQEGGPMAMLNTNNPPLRRAVYVHVSDLTSPYSIDESQLEEELARVREELEKPVEPNLGVPTELETNVSQKRLQPPRGGYNLCVRVGKVEVVVDKNRVDGSRVRLAEVEVGDETGSVSLRARDDQIDILQQVSDDAGAVVLRNCTLELYQGKHIRLAVTKWGKLSVYPDQVASTPSPPDKINKDRNFSLIDLGRVASPMSSLRDPYGAGETEGRQPQQQHHHQSSGGRTQSYSHQNPGQSRRGGRRSLRGKSAQSPVPLQQPHPQQHYTDRYPGGLHGYGTGFVDSSVLDPQQYSYNVRQQERHQHMMMQHQYQMQHRQMQQMYHPSPQAQRQQHDPAQDSPMLSGIPGIPSPPSFDGPPSFGPDVPMPMVGANPFLQHAQTYTQPTMAPPQEPRSHESTPPSTPQLNPETPRMNPQAATFDPASTSSGPST